MIMLSALLTVDKNADIIMSTLSPEIDNGLPRTDTEISANGDVVTIKVNAKNVSAMRAALNSYLGWIRITENINEMSDRNE
jgi:tRNA threonylcarbamoyladenosine modification (KEOPS) complex  Pcc1 subunit